MTIHWDSSVEVKDAAVERREWRYDTILLERSRLRRRLDWLLGATIIIAMAAMGWTALYLAVTAIKAARVL